MADLNALLVFAKVVEANSFSEAARRLRMPVSTVSRRVADLEAQLGVTLLLRSTRNLRLTDMGSELLQHAERSAQISDEIDGIVSDQLTNVAGTIRLSASSGVSSNLLAPLIGAFQRSYPEVRVRMFVADRFHDHIKEGVDLIFRVGRDQKPSPKGTRIFSYHHRLVASPTYLDAVDPPRSPADLCKHRLIAFTGNGSEACWRFVHVAGGGCQSVDVVPLLSMNDLAGTTLALLAGDGVGELSPMVHPDLLGEGRLVEVMPDWRLETLELSLVRVTANHVSRSVRIFEQFAAQTARELFPTFHV